MVRVLNWCLIDYKEALSRQKELVLEVVSGAEDVLVLCEHPATITLGRRSHEENVLLSAQGLQARKIPVLSVDRGGDVTLHAPGQLIIYPIINLRRAGLGLREYLVNLEQVVVDFLESFGIVANGDNDCRGVWVGNKKVASIGIGVSKWVSFHGIGLNISTDLELFRLIRPCGLSVQMTSLRECLGQEISVQDVIFSFERYFLSHFFCQPTKGDIGV